MRRRMMPMNIFPRMRLASSAFRAEGAVGQYAHFCTFPSSLINGRGSSLMRKREGSPLVVHSRESGDIFPDRRPVGETAVAWQKGSTYSNGIVQCGITC
ncbi:hypothetical protein CDAR_278991 [Caerostris darwini]|uniref:Secreted protein n=1 Tax=Caerostris darwini TaxID=1538125 RepID=A0AAV4WNH5_9ARAC|nr:hypothetical protein CDAR_278991 [Caerostris darwini]